jgi:hypothetical protein
LDRFSPDFVERRRAALQRFLDRLAEHPMLPLSEDVRTFLEAKGWGLETAKQLKKEGVFDGLGDAFMNAFAKLENEDPRFSKMKSQVLKFEENLTRLEKLQNRNLKRLAGACVRFFLNHGFLLSSFCPPRILLTPTDAQFFFLFFFFSRLGRIISGLPRALPGALCVQHQRICSCWFPD